MNKGWISINRKIKCHWLWHEKREFSKLEAWLDILLTVNHSEQKVMIKNTLFIVKRGESIKSLETWAKRWKWSRSRVKRFFDLLKLDNMIEYKTNNKTTVLSVCKYDSYQDTRTTNEHRTNIEQTSNEHQTHTNNNDNNINNENNDEEVDYKYIDDYIKQISSDNNQSWRETVYMQQRLRNGNLSTLLEKFKLSCKSLEKDKHKTLKDFKQNFVHWLNKQDLTSYQKR